MRAPYRSAAFDSGAHDLSQFTSGEADLDAWLQDHAAAAARARVAQTLVWAKSDGARVLAYYAISVHAVPRVEAPSRISQGVPDPVPAALTGKLALDRSLHGQRLGDVLLADALERVLDEPIPADFHLASQLLAG